MKKRRSFIKAMKYWWDDQIRGTFEMIVVISFFLAVGMTMFAGPLIMATVYDNSNWYFAYLIYLVIGLIGEIIQKYRYYRDDYIETTYHEDDPWGDYD